jgi:hypothetical protein
MAGYLFSSVLTRSTTKPGAGGARGGDGGVATGAVKAGGASDVGVTSGLTGLPCASKEFHSCVARPCHWPVLVEQLTREVIGT